jgi:hypothetical protein
MRAGSVTLSGNVNGGDAHVHAFVAHALGTCGAKGTDHIVVAGRRAIQSVLDLCRRGYRHVTCNTPAPGPHCADDRADSLWILNVPSETELLSFVATHSHDLRAGGTLVIGYETAISPAHIARLERVLLDKGFVTERQRTVAAGRTLLVCRAPERADRRAA